MNGRILVLLSVMAFASFEAVWGAGEPDAYDNLMPELRQVIRREGKVEPALLNPAKISTVVRGEIVGAPANVADQAYRIDIDASGVKITAGGEAGERYARTTLEQLLLLSAGERISAATIVDWPQLQWRGVMNDCGRNFLELQGVKAIIDIAARYKMNLFHWHLTDYHGWRLESKKYPALNARENFTRQIGRFYTQQEFREVIAYAKARGVTVMPEFDVPGHTFALRRGLGVKKMSDPKVAKAVNELLDELCSLAKPEDMPFIHLGTDEARIDAEYVSATQCSEWAQTVVDHGRKAVRWAPGEPMKVKGGEVLDMVWHNNYITNSTYRAFDSAKMYFASTDPFRIVNQTQFSESCLWSVDPARKFGAVACAWHDDAVGDDTMKLFRDVVFFPAVVGFADNHWHGRKENAARLGPMPAPGSDAARHVASFERRMRAQRDIVLKDFPLPFQFLSQSEMRWRLTDLTTGKEIAKDVPAGTMQLETYGFDNRHTAQVETWVYSPVARKVGAWIALMPFGTAYVRSGNGPLPELGAWDNAGGTVELNGVKIEPPKWGNPGLRCDRVSDADEPKAYRGAVYSNNVCEVPMTNEEVTSREPTVVELKAGWNHVCIKLPPAKNGKRTFTFALLNGSSDRPREVDGLRYSSTPVSAYVPEPQPLKSAVEITAVYYPGTEQMSEWDVIAQTCPERKPLLGWFDEGNPEAIDWQIKWAVEHGITSFCVDWYWNRGYRRLEHWVKGYYRSRYRKYLKWYMMYANHNQPGAHSTADQIAVTRYWIDNYFKTPEYYTIDGKPVVCIWDPKRLSEDFMAEAAAKGEKIDAATAIRRAFAISEKMVREVGIPGIHWQTMGHGIKYDEAHANTLAAEGFASRISYGFVNEARKLAPRASAGVEVLTYDMVVEAMPKLWQEMCTPKALPWWLPIPTGWDDRPRSFSHSTIICDRTPEKFAAVCREARRFCEEHGISHAVIHPINEWQEGSYIEPNEEYGFGMYEAIRDAFCEKPAVGWPRNVKPADVGMGPYDFPPLFRSSKQAWEFDGNTTEGWYRQPYGGGELEAKEGCLNFWVNWWRRNYNIRQRVVPFDAAKYRKFTIRMRITPNAKAGLGGAKAPDMRLKWGTSEHPIIVRPALIIDEKRYVAGCPVKADGEFHEYTLDLAANPDWKGMVDELWFDAAHVMHARVAIDWMRFE